MFVALFLILVAALFALIHMIPFILFILFAVVTFFIVRWIYKSFNKINKRVKHIEEFHRKKFPVIINENES